MPLCARCARPVESAHDVKWGGFRRDRCHNRTRPYDPFCMTGPHLAARGMQYHYESEAQFQQRHALDHLIPIEEWRPE